MIKKVFQLLTLGSVLLSSLLYLTVPPASAGADVDWLDRWDKRVKITINSTNINATLTNFPVLIHLSTNSGENAEDVSFVFDEVGSDANRKKIAVTKDDGTTQLYVEIEKWDAVNEKAWLWVSKSDWAIDDVVDTEIYLYYDNSKPDNDTYVGDPNSTPAENVWEATKQFSDGFEDGNFSAWTETAGLPTVITTDPHRGTYHEQAATTVWGNWYAYKTLASSHETLHIHAYVRIVTDPDATGALFLVFYLDGQAVIAVGYDGPNHRWWVKKLTGVQSSYYYNQEVDNDRYYCVDFRVTCGASGSYQLWIDGNPVSSQATTDLGDNVNRINAGYRSWNTITGEVYIDNVHVYSEGKSDAWVKASYETQRDHILDFGIEEECPRAGTVMSIR